MSDQTGLSTSDRALLRSVFSWARANGWMPVQTQYVDRQWSTEAERAPVVCAIRPNYGDNGEDNYGPVEVRVYLFATDGYRCVQLQKTSTREAIDVLCALGVLPIELSSTFAAGRKQDRARINRLERQVIVAMAEMPMSCRYHGTNFGFLGWQFEQPRCDSCKQPWRARQLLLAAGGVVPDGA